jgi:chromosome segregation ATPase
LEGTITKLQSSLRAERDHQLQQENTAEEAEARAVTLNERLLTTQQQLETSLKHCEVRRSTLQQQLDARAMSVQAKCQEVEDLQSVLAERETGLQMAQGDVKMHRKKAADLGTILEEARGRHQEELQQMDEMSLEMRRERTALQSEVAAMRAGMESKEQEAQGLADRLSRTIGQFEASLTEVAQLHSERVSVQAREEQRQAAAAVVVQGLQADLKVLHSSLEDSRRQLADRVQEIRRTKQAKEEERQERENLSRVMRGLQGEFTVLQSQIADLDAINLTV